MKLNKTALAIYSVSLTAGTVYLVYLQFKNRLVKQLMKLVRGEADKQQKVINETYLLDELEKLHYFDIHLLYVYTKAKIMNDKKKEEDLRKNLEEKSIFIKAEIEKELDGIIF